MSLESFDYLVREVELHIMKKTTDMWKTIPLEERLSLTLSCQASGKTQQCRSFSFQIGRSTVGSITLEVCEGIWQAPSQKYITMPSNEDEWRNIAEDLHSI